MNIEPGIYIEFTQGIFEIAVVDEVFVEEELQALKRNKGHLFYVSKGLVDLFLIQIEDSLETSDIPFSAHDYQDDAQFKQFLDSSECVDLKISYRNVKGEVLGNRQTTMTLEFCQELRERFKANLEQMADEEIFETALAKIQMKYQPFELEEHAVASISF